MCRRLGRSPLRYLRRRAGLTQGELASQAGLTQSFIAKVEASEKKLSKTSRNRLARALGIPHSDCVWSDSKRWHGYGHPAGAPSGGTAPGSGPPGATLRRTPHGSGRTPRGWLHSAAGAVDGSVRTTKASEGCGS
jgi:DNA-binding XRE family transcriptional regulator